MHREAARSPREVVLDGKPAFRGPDVSPAGFVPGQRVRLSEYAWIERAPVSPTAGTSNGPGDSGDPSHLVVRSVRSALSVELLTPLATSMLSSLSTPVTAAEVARGTGVPEPIAAFLIAMLLASGAAEPVPDSIDPELALRSLTQWSLATALPADRVTGELARAALALPSEGCTRDAIVLWEFHHDGSGRVDISQLRTAPATEHFGPTEYVEYDVTHEGLQVMGTFRQPHPVPEEVAALDWIAAAADDPDLAGHGLLAPLAEALGLPNLIGRIEREGGQTRLLWYLRSPAAFDDANAILRSAQVGHPQLDWSPLRSLIGGERPMRIVVGFPPATAGSVTHAAAEVPVAFEVFYPPALRRLPDILAPMGVGESVIAQVRAFADLPELTRTIALSPRGVTDLQTRRPLHVKITGSATGPVVKTYVETRSRPLHDRALMAGRGAIPQTWAAHDLRFHVRSRSGRNGSSFISKRKPAAVPLLEHLEDPSVVAPGDVPLPDVTPARNSTTLSEVLTSRRSERDWTGPPISLEQLAAVLFGAMHPNLDDQQHRYPSAGNVYETDVVVFADRVTDLERGVYLYRPAAHALRPLAGDPAARDHVLAGAGRSTGNSGPPQVVCVLAARFDDLAAEYHTAAYALMLKDAGVLMATISLVAADLGVGCVLLGQGDSDAFARATGLDYYLHGAIAELALSTRVTTDVTAPD